MVYRLVLDENVEHEVFHRLDNYGHDVEHVDFVPELGKGTSDHPIAQYSLETDRVIVTYDSDIEVEAQELRPGATRGERGAAPTEGCCGREGVG